MSASRKYLSPKQADLHMDAKCMYFDTNSSVSQIKINSTKARDTDNLVPAKNKDQPLEVGQSMKIGGM